MVMMEAVLAAVMAAVTVTAEDIELKEPGVEKISRPFCGWLIFFYSGPQKHGSIRHAFLSTVGAVARLVLRDWLVRTRRRLRSTG